MTRHAHSAATQLLLSLVAGAGLLACATTASGARFEWSGAVSSDWSNPGNWTNGVAPFGSGTNDVWLMATGNPPTNQDIAGLYVNALTFNTNAAGYVINGTGITLKNIMTYSAPVPVTNLFNVPVTLAARNGWRVDNNPAMVYLVFNKALGETGGSWPIDANYNGTIILNATNNTFTGGLKNNQSTVRVGSDANLGPVPGSYVSNFFNGGYGTWAVTNGGSYRRTTINAKRGMQPYTGNAPSFSVGSNLKLIFPAPIVGGGGLTHNTADVSLNCPVLVLTGSNSFTGSLYLMGGMVVLGSDYALGGGASGSVVSIIGTLDLNGHTIWNRDLLFVNGSGVDGGGELRNNDTAHPVTLAGNINLGGGAGGNAVQFGGNGDIVLGAATVMHVDRLHASRQRHLGRGRTRNAELAARSLLMLRPATMRFWLPLGTRARKGIVGTTPRFSGCGSTPLRSWTSMG